MTRHKTLFPTAFLAISAILFLTEQSAWTQPTVNSARIWDAAPHNAFTDLIRYQDRWICVFREGAGHATGEGKLRILMSKDGRQWESAALIAEPGRDLRDAKISVTPDNRLMLSGGSADPMDHGPGSSFHSIVTFSSDGRNWTPLRKVLHARPEDERFWLWRVKWFKGKAYGVAYQLLTSQDPTKRRFAAFVCTSSDGIKYERLTENVDGLTEAAIAFERNGKMTMVVRTSSAKTSAVLMSSLPPFKSWESLDLTADAGGNQIGGPDILILPNGRMIGSGRKFSDRPGSEQRTVVFEIDRVSGRTTTIATLPSGGDTSYPGMIWYRNRLWMSYYSSHEGKAMIYLATIDLGTIAK